MIYIYKYTDKSVRNNNQIVKFNRDIDKVSIISKSGRQKVFELTFNMRDFQRFNPTFNKDYNINEFLKRELRKSGNDKKIEDTLFDRIVDSQRMAFKNVLSQIKGA